MIFENWTKNSLKDPSFRLREFKDFKVRYIFSGPVIFIISVNLKFTKLWNRNIQASLLISSSDAIKRPTWIAE